MESNFLSAQPVQIKSAVSLLVLVLLVCRVSLLCITRLSNRAIAERYDFFAK